MKKFNFRVLISLVLILAMSFTLFACNPKVKILDPDYVLSFEGLGDVTSITKGELAKLKRTSLTAKPSDKPDAEEKNAVGTLLSDLLAKYSRTLGEFKSITFFGSDGASYVLNENQFNPEKGGTDVLISYQYDGTNLSTKEDSGALRAIANNNANGSWIFKLNKIAFNVEVILKAPTVSSVYFMENYAKTSSWAVSAMETHFGIKMTDLDAVLSVIDNGILFVSGYDFVGNGAPEKRDIAIPKENYSSAILSFTAAVTEGKLPTIEAPVFEGPECQKMMKMKNTLYIASGNSAVLSLETLFKVLDDDQNGEILLKDLLTLINCKTTVVANDKTKIADKDTAKIIFKDSKYYVKEGTTENELISLVPFIDSDAIPNFSFDVKFGGQTVKIDQTAMKDLTLEEMTITISEKEYSFKAVKLSALLKLLDIGDYTSFTFVGIKDNAPYPSAPYLKGEYENVYVAFKLKDDKGVWTDVRQNISHNEKKKGNMIKVFSSIEFV